jgi:hypothetical protein
MRSCRTARKAASSRLSELRACGSWGRAMTFNATSFGGVSAGAPSTESRQRARKTEPKPPRPRRRSTRYRKRARSSSPGCRARAAGTSAGPPAVAVQSSVTSSPIDVWSRTIVLEAAFPVVGFGAPNAISDPITAWRTRIGDPPSARRGSARGRSLYRRRTGRARGRSALGASGSARIAARLPDGCGGLLRAVLLDAPRHDQRHSAAVTPNITRLKPWCSSISGSVVMNPSSRTRGRTRRAARAGRGDG